MDNNKEKIQGLNVIMNGITINGPMFDIHDNGTVNNYFNTSQTKSLYTEGGEEYIFEKEGMSESPLRNHIFQVRIFDTNDRLTRLRDTIASAINMGEATTLYGNLQEVRINPNAKNEWYYIIKAIKEVDVAKDFTSTDFLDQMREWFPNLFPHTSMEEWEDSKRRLSKSISAEKKLWKHGAMQEEIPLKDMWAKQKLLGMDAAKMERVYAIAYKGLFQNLEDLKQEIIKEKSR